MPRPRPRPALVSSNARLYRQRRLAPKTPPTVVGVLVAALAISACSSKDEKMTCSAAVREPIVQGTALEQYLALGDEDTRALVRLHDGAGFTVSSCTGSLIRPDWLVTARHCLDIERLAIELRIGAEVRTLEARDVKSHPELDVALVLVAPALGEEDPVRPFALEKTPVDQRWLGERAELAGFGIAEEGRLPTEPRYAVEAIREIGDDTLVVDGRGRSGACLGDSGGPLLVRNERGRPAILGILSAGSANCLQRDTYVRIDRVAEWIETIAGPEDSDPIVCGAVDARGTCSFGRALMCREGLLDVTTCEGGKVCGWDFTRGGFACVPATDDPCLGVGSAGACDTGSARQCRDGVLVEESCGPCDRCAYEPTSGAPHCYPE